MAWGVDLRGAHPQREPGTGGVALWDFADLPRLFRFAHNPLPAAVSFPAASLLRDGGYAEHLQRDGNWAVAIGREVFEPFRRDDPSRAAYDLFRCFAAGGIQYAGGRTAGRDAGTALLRSQPSRPLLCGPH